MNTMNLLTNFKSEGFVYIPGFLNGGEVDQMLNQLDVLIKDKVPMLPSEQVFYEAKGDASTLKQIQYLFNYSPFFHQMMFRSKFEALAELLLEDKVVGKNMQYFNKPPLIGKATPPHQDGYYFMLNPCDALTMWLGLDDVDEGNGCIHYVKGSHGRGIRPHGKTQVLGFSLGITDYGTKEDLANEVYFPTKPGDLLVHHALTIHRADPNTSNDRNRRAIGFIYYAARAKEDSDRKKVYQETLAKELKETGKI